ncbi:hypothetical protein PSQ19_15895 [Devosia algicola]|uniref:Uncharacterized protein n=1 Tax=Devosia algicola TaxID=3026418 RepID=A0ABY7YLR4_9HYPH|nr:hypothetical protein [Devosia algicola]WDR02127.1 hypothetical protein PSQ19_15895 [Devosia algicola]
MQTGVVMILQILAIWAVVALVIFWFVRDERARRARRAAELDAAARIFARPSANRMAIARLTPLADPKTRIPALSTDDLDMAAPKR